MASIGLIPVQNNNELIAEETKKATLSREVAKISDAPEALKTELVAYVKDGFADARKDKLPIKDLMIENLRQINGEYDPAKLADIRELGSENFTGITGTKCRATYAWITGGLFQPGQTPWDIEPTPVPELTPEQERMANQVLAEEMQSFLEQAGMAMQQVGMNPMAIQQMVQQKASEFKTRFKKIRMDIAKEKAQSMKLKMEDQLVEGGYYKALSDCIWNIIHLKAGFLSGPIYRNKKVRVLNVDPITKRATPGFEDRVIAEWDAPCPFDIYPAPGATGINDSAIYERIPWTRKEIQGLIGLEEFDEDAIREVLAKFQEKGLHEWTWDQQEIEEAKDKETSQYYDWDKIDGVKYSGPIPGKMLLEWAENPEDKGQETFGQVLDPDFDYDVVLYLIDQWILKISLNENPLGLKPYYKASFVEKPGTFWGLGLPETIKCPQGSANATSRAMDNNVGMASGPQVAIDTDKIAPGENVDKMWPWRIWKFTKQYLMGGAKPIEFFQPSLHASELIQVYNHWSKVADEHSGVPAYAHGDSQVGGAGNTASGLSMLMGASDRGIKGVAKSLDDNVIAPSIEALYYDNFELDDAVEYIGDVKIRAKGSSALLEKQQKALRLTDFGRATANPIDLQIMGIDGRTYVLKETAKSMDLEADKVVPDKSMMQPIPMPGQGMAPTAGPQTLDQAGNPAQGAGQELFKPMAQ